MRPLSIAITVLISLWALAASPAASGVLLAVALLSAGLMTLRWCVQQILLIVACEFSPGRVGAQLTLARSFRGRGQARAMRIVTNAYGLAPQDVARFRPEEREAERGRIELLLRDLDRAATILPTGIYAPDRSALRRALAALAAAAAPS